MSTLARVTASTVTRKIGEDTYEFSRLTLRDFGFLQKAAFDSWKKNRIETYQNHIGLFPEHARIDVVKAVLDEVSKMDESDLPPKVMWLDKDGNVTSSESEKVQEVSTEYAQWWMAFTHEGRLTTVWLSLRRHHPELTLDEVEELIMDSGESIEDAANIIGDISSPQVNDDGAPAKKKNRRGR